MWCRFVRVEGLVSLERGWRVNGASGSTGTSSAFEALRWDFDCDVRS